MFTARLSAFLSWWKAELLSFVPVRVQKFFTPRQLLILFAARANRLILRYSSGDDPDEACEVSLRGTTVGGLREDIRRALQKLPGRNVIFGLDLPADWALTRSLLLPAAAAGDVAEAMRYEIERRTPFTADEVYHTFQILPDPNDESQINVRLHMIPRERIDSSIQAMSSLGVRPTRIGIAATGLSAANGFNFLPDDKARTGLGRNTLITAMLGVLAALLLSVAVSVSLANKKKLVEALNNDATALRAEIVKITRVQSQIDQLVRQRRLLQERTTMRPPLVVVMNELTRLLPDDTWLRNLRIKNGEISISGEAERADLLIGLIEDSVWFQNVSMTSAVTRNRTSKKDVFRLTFQISAKEN